MYSKQRTALIAVLSLAASVFSPTAEAGNGASGGGEAVLCYRSSTALNAVYSDLKEAETRLSDPENENLATVDLRLSELKQAPQMLDYFEASRPTGVPTTSRGLEQSKTNGYSPAKIYELISRMDPKFMAEFRPFITKDSQWKAHDGVMRLHDSNTSYLFKQGCLKVQVAYFNDELQTVFYNSNITALMEEPSLIALKLHEDIYRFYRHGLRKSFEIATMIQDRMKRGRIFSPEIVRWSENAVRTQVTSDTSRALVSYLMSENAYSAPDLSAYLFPVAKGVHLEKKNNVQFYLAKDYNPKAETPLFLESFFLE